MSNTKEWQQSALKLAQTNVMSWRQIAKVLEVPKSTVSDFLRDYTNFKEDKPSKKSSKGVTHLYICDPQVKSGIDLSYLHHIGMYIARKKPDVIICAGDFADMPSLSDWDKGKKSAEGRRIKADIDSVVEGMSILLKPLHDLQAKQCQAGEKVYEPRKIMTLGNHDVRIERYVENNAAFEGFLGIEDLQYVEFGWEVVPFLEPIVVDGVSYCHYFTNPFTGKPLSGSAANMLSKIGTSFVQGHKQTLDVATRFLPTTGQQQWGIVAGAGYPHYEDYKGMHNHHWRGIVVMHNVKDGSFDPLFVSLDWLKEQYGEIK